MQLHICVSETWASAYIGDALYTNMLCTLCFIIFNLIGGPLFGSRGVSW